jgi:hypothetical protein
LLAVLLGVLTSASAFAFNNNFTGGLSAAEHIATARTAGTTSSVRSDTADPSLSFGGTGDIDAALIAGNPNAFVLNGVVSFVLPASLDLPSDIARIRDGRSRAPPSA